MQKNEISFQRGNIVRGLAILAVMLLHILPYLQGVYHGKHQLFFVFIDQLARFCVPAFLMLSGYGLAVKYSDSEKIEYFDFLKKRVGKILPLYLLWSFASVLIINSVPEWSFDNQPASLMVQLMFGQADYQLYFLPVLFQLYGLFPFLWLMRKKPKLLLFLSIIIQVIVYIFFSSKFTNSDRLEYVFSLSWIGYFVFGVYLKLGKLKKNWLRFSPFIAVFSIFAISLLGVNKINSGIDPLPVLKFTKLVLIPYSLTANLCLMLCNVKINERILGKFLTRLTILLSWLGKNSFLIFLSHTIFFRIIYAIIYQQLESFVLIRAIAFWLFTVVVSQKIISAKFFAKK